MDMIILYILLIAYIVAINFYAFLLVKSYAQQERENEYIRHTAQNSQSEQTPPAPMPQKTNGKLIITGVLGGAIAIYVCMFIFKYRKTDLLLMVLMPVLAVLNVYLWVLLFRSGFGFLVIR